MQDLVVRVLLLPLRLEDTLRIRELSPHVARPPDRDVLERWRREQSPLSMSRYLLLARDLDLA